MRRKVVSEEEQRDSGGEQRGDEDDIPLGPQSNISLLDQHQHLKEKAEGGGGESWQQAAGPGGCQGWVAVWGCRGHLTASLTLPSSEGVSQGEAAEGGGEDPGERGGGPR